MATVTPVTTTDPDLRFQRVRWTGFVASGDVGTGVEWGSYSDRSVQVLGTFAGGISIDIEGSNDGGTTWTVLTDPQGNALTFTTARLEQITELTHKVRCRATAGAGGAAVDVHMLFGGNRR